MCWTLSESRASANSKNQKEKRVSWEQLALFAWKRLGDGSGPAVSQQLDPAGIELALQRDDELESGEEIAISSEEFLRCTRR